MANRDPAFLWETEALRTSSNQASTATRSAGADWLTLREASDATGVQLSTLRNWARKGRVPTALEESADGTHRMVSMEGVRARARQLGHQVVEPRPTPPVAAASPPLVEEEQASPPPGTMLVPIEAWDKMLHQLGNLHEAGQQLAEARERAARAETEASFLRERLAEMRATPSQEPATAPAQEEISVPPEPEPASPTKMPRFSAYLWRMAVSGRNRK
ncbi:MAG TPA: hypothetical protein VNT92_02380 [Acidimicrobiia bacterium]|nr:hypothetical protein [Acidimicrobiia bacterium]